MAILLMRPDRDQVRVCLGPGCVLYFLQTGTGRRFCTSGCGNRARAMRHDRRGHRGPSTTRLTTPPDAAAQGFGRIR